MRSSSMTPACRSEEKSIKSYLSRYWKFEMLVPIAGNWLPHAFVEQAKIRYEARPRRGQGSNRHDEGELDILRCQKDEAEDNMRQLLLCFRDCKDDAAGDKMRQIPLCGSSLRN